MLVPTTQSGVNSRLRSEACIAAVMGYGGGGSADASQDRRMDGRQFQEFQQETDSNKPPPRWAVFPTSIGPLTAIENSICNQPEIPPLGPSLSFCTSIRTGSGRFLRKSSDRTSSISAVRASFFFQWRVTRYSVALIQKADGPSNGSWSVSHPGASRSFPAMPARSSWNPSSAALSVSRCRLSSCAGFLCSTTCGATTRSLCRAKSVAKKRCSCPEPRAGEPSI